MNPLVGCHHLSPGPQRHTHAYHEPGGRLPLLSPGPQLPSQPLGVTAFRPVPTYTAWWQRHIGVRNLPSGESNPQPLYPKSDALPQCHDAAYSVTFRCYYVVRCYYVSGKCMSVVWQYYLCIIVCWHLEVVLQCVLSMDWDDQTMHCNATVMCDLVVFIKHV